MSSRLDQTSAVLGEYMLKGWTLTDLHCSECRATPLMREPAHEAARNGRAPIQFCAACDGGPDGRARASATASSGAPMITTAPIPTRAESSSSSISVSDNASFATAQSGSEDELEDEFETEPATPTRPQSQSQSQNRVGLTSSSTASPNSPPDSHRATRIGDADAATESISQLLLKGYTLLSSSCPRPECRGMPLVGYPRRKDGSKDSRRECVSCGGRWVDERDVLAGGLKEQVEPVAATPVASSTRPDSLPTEDRSTAEDDAPTRDEGLELEEPESPRSKARRELYASGEAIMTERRKVEEDKKKAAATSQAATGRSTPKLDVPAFKSKPRKTKAAAPTEGYDLGDAPVAESSSTAVSGAGSSVSKTSSYPSLNPQQTTSTRTLHRPPFVAEEHLPREPDGKLRVVLVSTGSVASIKMPLIVDSLLADGNVEVQVVATKASLHFYDAQAIEEKHGEAVTIWTDVDEWSDWRKIGDPILHIELRRWADMVVVVPASADTLAKIAAGMCDTLALSLLRALDAKTPVILCPAMNTLMYAHPTTALHISFAQDVLSYYILGPQGSATARLACGDVGAGKMTEWTDIVAVILGYATITRQRPKADNRALLKGLLSAFEPNIPTMQPVASLSEPAATEVIPVAPPPEDLVFRPPEIDLPVPKLRSRSKQIKKAVERAVESAEPEGVKSGLRTAKSAVTTLLSVIFSILLYPVFLLLHFAFTLSSIVLRIVQANPQPPPEITKDAPKHVALILPPGKGLSRQELVERYVESVRRAVQWAGEWGVDSLSVWDGEGLGVRYHSAVTARLLHLPPSPPNSTPGTPPLIDAASLGEDGTVRQSLYVTVDPLDSLDPAGSNTKRVDILFLSPAADDVIARITREYATYGTNPDEITEKRLDMDIKTHLHLPSEPDLVIIHPLDPPGFWRGLLPRPAPELHGYPAWMLRITEIYTHPPTLPLYLRPLGALLQNSPLPVFRKLGALFPDASSLPGVLDVEAWEGAQGAWERVEQRKGK